MQKVSNAAGFFLQFLPVSVFLSYAYRAGEPTPRRWLEAFALGSGLSLGRIIVSLWRKRPINPLAIGTDLYLFFGLLACLTQSEWMISLVSSSQAAGLLVALLITGAISTFASSRGYIFAEAGNRTAVVKMSIVLLAVTSAATALSFKFRGDTLYSGVIPVVAVAICQRLLRRRTMSNSIQVVAP